MRSSWWVNSLGRLDGNLVASLHSKFVKLSVLIGAPVTIMGPVVGTIG